MISFLNNMLFGSGGGMTGSRLREFSERNRFSDYLPYAAYDDTNHAYFNADDSFGFIFECRPLVYASEGIRKVLAGIFSCGIPGGSILQFSLFADPDIDYLLRLYAQKDVIDSELTRLSTQSVADYFKEGTKGLKQMGGIPVRNFRLFVTLKLYKFEGNDKVADLRNSIFEILRGCDLFPEHMHPDVLVNFLIRLFNDDESFGWTEYDDRIPIRSQVIKADTRIRTGWKEIKIGEKHLGCTSVKKMARDAPDMLANRMVGGMWGVSSDSSQLPSPFLYTVNVFFDDVSTPLLTKCNIVLNQKAVGSLAPGLVLKQQEYLWASGELGRGTTFVRVMPLLWHIARSETELKESQARAKRIWESEGFLAQQESLKGMLNVLFLAGLPFGLHDRKDNIDFISRDFILDSESAVRMLPVEADFAGTSDDCTSLFVGRKGQVAPFSFFTKSAINYNALIAASSGGGKSFLMNYFVHNAYRSGDILRVVDLGYSYKRICDAHGGRFIDFTKDSDIVVNPFSSVYDIDDSITNLTLTFLQMVYSNTQKPSDNETEMTVMKTAVMQVWNDYGNEGIPDLVAKALKNYRSIAKERGVTGRLAERLSDIGSELAYNMEDFTSGGSYGRWFNGKSTVNIGNDDFVVLELEKLKTVRELFSVVMFQLLNLITSDLYLSDRKRKRMIIFDEARQVTKINPMIPYAIEEGMRLARKYHGSFTVITQSMLDLDLFGEIGPVINSQATFKLLLQSPDFAKARDKGFLDVDPFTLEIMRSVKTPRPRYSEVIAFTPGSMGVVRLIVPDFLYYLFTSDAGEVSEMNGMVADGMTHAGAVSEMVRKYRNPDFKAAISDSDRQDSGRQNNEKPVQNLQTGAETGSETGSGKEKRKEEEKKNLSDIVGI